MGATGRSSRLVKLALFAAVPVVFLLAYLDLLREQAAALADFTTEQETLARAFATAIEARHRLVPAPLEGDASPAALHALFNPPTAPPATGRAAPHWLVVAGDRWLLLGDDGDDRLAWRGGDGDLDAGVRSLLGAMKTGSHGARVIERTAALALGLERRRAVAAWAPVPEASPPAAGSRPLVVGVVTSMSRIRDRATMATWRLAAATGLAGLLVALFGVVMTRQDRRARSLAEALRLSAATAALRERGEKIVESIPVGVLELDAALSVTAANPFLAERGVKRSGSLAEALPRASRDDIAALEALLVEAQRDRRPRQRLGLHMRLASAEPRDIDAHAIPLATPLPGVDCYLLLHDRTEVRALERSLARAEKLATIGTLAAGVAHEVGTPLGIISGRAEQLLDRAPTDADGEPVRKGLSSIIAQVDKVSTTIRQLLDFARVRPVDAVAVTPTQALESVAALLDHRFQRAGVKLTLDASPTVPALAADPGQLEQVLVNLLINACDACVDGGHVTARATAAGDGRVCIEIADDGSGIAPEHLPLVIDPFFTTKKRGKGTGLGLTIAADIVKNHGGSLEIESEPGRGTTVRVLLPAATNGKEVR